MELLQLIASYEETLNRAEKLSKHKREQNDLDPNITLDELLDGDSKKVDDTACSSETLDDELVITLREMMKIVVKHPDNAITTIQKCQNSFISRDILECLMGLAEDDEGVCSDQVHAKIAKALD